MARCLVGCGSNVGKRRDYLDRAMELLRFMPGVTLVSVSRYRDTRPIGGPPGQGVFLNGACLLETDLSPHDVLGMLAAVENTLDRERGERWGPRTVDLDLLLYDDIVLDTETLTLPHPRMVTRRFVLEPCVEIAADVVHPLAACSLESLLESISAPHPHVAVVGVPGSGAAEVAAAVAHATLARLVSAPPEYTVVADGAARHGDAATAAMAWRQAVDACAKPLLAKRWKPDPHGTVADYWLHTVRLAAADTLAADALAADALSSFERHFAMIAAETVPPHVAILLVASPDTLEERVVSGGLQSADRGAVGVGRQSGMAVCAATDDAVARLLRLQDRIAAAIRCPETIAAGGPRAVVTVAAGDLDQAVQEAVAVVEAMA